MHGPCAALGVAGRQCRRQLLPQQGTVGQEQHGQFLQQVGVAIEPLQGGAPVQHQLRRLRPVAGQHPGQGRAVDRLGQVIVHARLQAAFAVARHGARRHGDDGYVATPVQLAVAELARGGQPVQARHLHIHQDQVVGFARRAFEHGQAIVGQRHAVAQLFQQPQGQPLVDGIVLGQQHAQAVAVRPGHGRRLGIGP